jgi:hypothetical protein
MAVDVSIRFGGQAGGAAKHGVNLSLVVQNEIGRQR